MWFYYVLFPDAILRNQMNIKHNMYRYRYFDCGQKWLGYDDLSILYYALNKEFCITSHI